MERRDRFTASLEKRDAIRNAEAAGQVADSLEVRLRLLERMDAGELTLQQVQDELKRIKRNAKKNGQLTRSQVWSRS